jgi:hypothetical protein
MSKPEPTKYIPEINPELASFYQALGQLNTNLVARIIRNPDVIAKVTDFIGGVVLDLGPEDCGQGFYWDGVQCVRKPESVFS